MEEVDEKTPIQLFREKLAKNCPSLPDFKIIEMCDHYGINYDIPDVNTYRIFSILAAAESQLMKLQEESQ